MVLLMIMIILVTLQLVTLNLKVIYLATFILWNMKNEELRERSLWIAKVDIPKSMHWNEGTWLIGKPLNFYSQRVHIFLINFLASTTFIKTLDLIKIKEMWLLGTGILIVRRYSDLSGWKNYEKQTQDHKKYISLCHLLFG